MSTTLPPENKTGIQMKTDEENVNIAEPRLVLLGQFKGKVTHEGVVYAGVACGGDTFMYDSRLLSVLEFLSTSPSVSAASARFKADTGSDSALDGFLESGMCVLLDPADKDPSFFDEVYLVLDPGSAYAGKYQHDESLHVVEFPNGEKALLYDSTMELFDRSSPGTNLRDLITEVAAVRGVEYGTVVQSLKADLHVLLTQGAALFDRVH